MNEIDPWHRLSDLQSAEKHLHDTVMKLQKANSQLDSYLFDYVTLSESERVISSEEARQKKETLDVILDGMRRGVIRAARRREDDSVRFGEEIIPHI